MGQPSLKIRLESVTSSELLMTPDADLQGIKDRRLSELIQGFRDEEIVLLCDLAQSGKIRHLAQRFVPDGFNTGKYNARHLPELRDKYADCTAQHVRTVASTLFNGTREQGVMLGLFLEKATAELSLMSIDALRGLRANGNGEWPKNVLEAVFRKKAQMELDRMTTSELQLIRQEKGDRWPADIVTLILQSRPAAPSPEKTDDWREQL